jgi:hypothetical protein
MTKVVELAVVATFLLVGWVSVGDAGPVNGMSSATVTAGAGRSSTYAEGGRGLVHFQRTIGSQPAM